MDAVIENVTFEPEIGAWVCWDNNPNTANLVKQLHPFDPVFIHNRETGERTRYYITVINYKPQMRGGKLIFEPEETQI